MDTRHVDQAGKRSADGATPAEQLGPLARAGVRDRADVDGDAGARRDVGVMDPRLGLDRRRTAGASTSDGTSLNALERRRGPGRRRSDFMRAAEEGELTPEQFLFLKAIDEFKRANNKLFPTWTDVLEVVRLLGYRKTMPSELNFPAAEDWRERPDTPSNVRPRGWERRFMNGERDAA